MPQPECSICKTPEVAAQVALEVANGESDRAIVSRHPGLSQSSVNRHRRNCLKQRRKPGSAESPHESASKWAPVRRRAISGQKSRVDSNADPDRCRECKQSIVAIDPESLLRRAERLLYHAESIAQRASEDENYRLLLLALDRANKSIETLARATGLIHEGVNVNVGVGISGDPLAQVSNVELSAMIAKLRREVAIESGDVIDAKVIGGSVDCEPLRGAGTALAVPVDT